MLKKKSQGLEAPSEETQSDLRRIAEMFFVMQLAATGVSFEQWEDQDREAA